MQYYNIIYDTIFFAICKEITEKFPYHLIAGLGKVIRNIAKHNITS